MILTSCLSPSSVNGPGERTLAHSICSFPGSHSHDLIKDESIRALGVPGPRPTLIAKGGGAGTKATLGLCFL